MKKMRMCFPKEKTFSDGFQEYILDCKARNLRGGTIHHYQESVKQIYKRIPPNTPISSLNQQTMQKFYIALRDDPNLNEVSMGTYARDLKTLMRFFMKCGHVPVFSHLSIILIHIHGFLQKFPHFCNDRLRRQYLYPSAKRLNPRKEGWAALHGDSDNAMAGIAGNHHHVLAELVHHGGFL